MKAYVMIVAGFGLVMLASAAASAQGSGQVPGSGPGSAQSQKQVRACDQCKDLCPLVDLYLQQEEGLKIWRRYAESTPAVDRTPLPADFVTKHGGSIENLAAAEFTEWVNTRQLPCKPPRKRKQKQTPTTTLLATTTDSKCEIQYNGAKLEGPNLDAFLDAWKCKLITDALMAHENVHQEKCLGLYLQGEAKAQEFYSDPAKIADNELNAWTVEKEILAERIRNIARGKKCGWRMTKGQEHSMNAMPSQKQTLAMEKRGWKAVTALGGKK